MEYDLSDGGAYGNDAKVGGGHLRLMILFTTREPADRIFKAIESSLLKGHLPPSPAVQTPPTQAPPRANV